jgi:hypothetical protein
LKRPTPPTAAQILAGQSTPPVSDEHRAGLRAAAVLATRRATDSEHALHAQADRRADAEAERDKAIIAAYERRIEESI